VLFTAHQTRRLVPTSAASGNVRPVVALPVVLAGCPLVRFGLLPERLGVQLPGVLGSLPSRLRTVSVPKALLQPGRLLVQLLGAAVGGKLVRPRSRSTFPCSPHPVSFVHHRPCLHRSGCPV
jgi:hypothetical protein